MHSIQFDSKRSLDFIGLGRACIDLNANEIHRPMEETLTFTKYVGGSPANITIALARLGAKTGFIGRVADDSFGRYIRSYMLDNHIDTTHLVTDTSRTATGLAFTEIKSPTDCSILMYRDNAADLKLAVGDIDPAYIKQAKALLISGTALAQSPSREAVFTALEYARRYNVVTFFDIDYRGYTWKSPEEVSIYCHLVAEKCDVIIGGREEFDHMEKVFGPGEQDDERTADYWFKHQAKLVIVKHGGDGSTAYTKSGHRYKAGIYKTEQVVKTFGAGDSFAGAFIYGMLQGWSIETCQQLGSAAASIVVSSHACSDAMPTLAQITALVEKHNLEVSF